MGRDYEDDEPDDVVTLCDAGGRKILDVADVGGLVALRIHGSELVACVELDGLIEALAGVGFDVFDVGATSWGNDAVN